MGRGGAGIQAAFSNRYTAAAEDFTVDFLKFLLPIFRNIHRVNSGGKPSLRGRLIHNEIVNTAGEFFFMMVKIEVLHIQKYGKY